MDRIIIEYSNNNGMIIRPEKMYNLIIILGR